MNVRRPRGDDLDDFLEIRGGTVIHGHVDGIELAHGLTEEECEQLALEHAEALRRKRPMGFTACWDDGQGLRRVA